MVDRSVPGSQRTSIQSEHAARNVETDDEQATSIGVRFIESGELVPRTSTEETQPSAVDEDT